MTRPCPSTMFVALAASLAISAAIVHGYLTDTGVHAPPDYYTFRPPAVGDSYTDPVFGTSIKRISDSMNTVNAAAGGNVTLITNEYSTMTPFNSDSTRLLLQHLSYFALYDGEGRLMGNLPFSINAASEPRWSRRDPNLLYFHQGNQVKHYNVATGAISVLHTFSEYGIVSGKGESDICFDGDHLVLAGDNRYIFLYQISTDTKGPVLDAGRRAFDQLYITPDDNVLVGWLEAGPSRYNGVELYDRNMNFRRQVGYAIGHMDVTRDTDGSELMVWANAADPSPICMNGLVKVRLADARQTCLLSLAWSMALHVSGPDNNGWVFVGTYIPSDPSPQGGSWAPYANEILQVRLDGSEVRRLAHHRSRKFNDYYYTPRVASNRHGTKLVYSSNYGLQAMLNRPANYSDAYLISVPASDSLGPPPTIFRGQFLPQRRH